MDNQQLSKKEIRIQATLLDIFHQNWIRPIAVAVIGGLIVVGVGSFAISNIAHTEQGAPAAAISPEGFLGLWKQVDAFNRALTFLFGGYLAIQTLRKSGATKKSKDDGTGETFIILAIGYWWLIGSALSIASQVAMWKIFGWLPDDPEIVKLIAASIASSGGTN